MAESLPIFKGHEIAGAAGYTRSVMDAVALDPRIMVDVMEASNESPVGKGLYIVDEDGSSQLFIGAVQGHLTRLTAFHIPVGHGYAHKTETNPTYDASSQRPARLLAAQYKAQFETFDPDRPLRVHIPAYNNVEDIDRFWQSIEKPPGSAHEVETIYWLDAQNPRKEVVLNCISTELPPELDYPIMYRRGATGAAEGWRYISVEAPMLVGDLEMLAFTVNAIAVSLKDYDFKIDRSV